MCGIAGWVGKLQDTQDVADCMVQALRHRGPDGCGVRSWPEATLVHTRLSIIDLSPAGAQPMANEDGTVWTIFNGEIYNHHEIRRDLEARGHVFRGHADSEVLPHLYEEEGSAFVTKLRGMFALATYDTRSRTLLLARDCFGIKPLFYAPAYNRLAFASEINALLNFPGIDARPDRQAIYDFAALFYIPAPETFYTGIRALQPGELLEARLDAHGITWKTQLYHQWAITPDPALALAQATDRADALIKGAVRRQLESDVPLGALLSGGIDSSLISAAAQEALDGGLQTFNVRFGDKAYDETWAALAVAQHIGSSHKTLHMDDIRGSWDHITSLLRHAGQPFADTSLFAVNAVCQLMRQHVTVALSGDGGDEGFGGYYRNWQLRRIARLQKCPELGLLAAATILTPLAYLGIVHGSRPLRLRELSAADDTAVMQSLFCQLHEADHRKLCKDTDLLPIRRLFEPRWEHRLPPHTSRLERLFAHATEIGTRLELPNDFLFKVDTASMRESLEVRVPMLDEELFALGLLLPHYLKVQGRAGKRVLRAVAQQQIPSKVANKPKHGFVISVNSWLNADFKAHLHDTLLGPSSTLPEFFSPEVYGPMILAFCEGRHDRNHSPQRLFRRVIMLLSVHLALEGRFSAASERVRHGET
jgi:asparagine synthase (glutamine-hydrolysing)